MGRGTFILGKPEHRCEDAHSRFAMGGAKFLLAPNFRKSVIQESFSYRLMLCGEIPKPLHFLFTSSGQKCLVLCERFDMVAGTYKLPCISISMSSWQLLEASPAFFVDMHRRPVYNEYQCRATARALFRLVRVLNHELRIHMPFADQEGATSERWGLFSSGDMWYPIAGPSPIAVHGPISGPKDLYRAVDRYRARSYRSKRLELRFAVAVHSPIAVHGPITVQPEFFKFPRRSVPICLSTDFSAFSSFRRETCESTSLSALIFVPFQNKRKFGEGYLASLYGA